MLYTVIVSDIQNNFCTQHVLPMFCEKKSFWQRFTCNKNTKIGQPIVLKFSWILLVQIFVLLATQTFTINHLTTPTLYYYAILILRSRPCENSLAFFCTTALLKAIKINLLYSIKRRWSSFQKCRSAKSSSKFSHGLHLNKLHVQTSKC